jgi:hypothetical protein
MDGSARSEDLHVAHHARLALHPMPMPVRAGIVRTTARLALVDEKSPGSMRTRRPRGRRRKRRAWARLVGLKGVATTRASVLLDEGPE